QKQPGGGWPLCVANADVSSNVRTGTILDKEAVNRGNSVYFPDQVIPMIPEVLSNGLCSLNPQDDRLCMVSEMVIGQDGH
ncbi:RNB domain-containing ribonuclease, partial [Psychromonas arctica]